MKYEKVYSDYQEIMADYQDEKNEILANENTSEQFKEKKIQEIKQAAKAEQQDYKKRFVEALEEDIATVKEPLRNTEMPPELLEVLKLNLNRLELEELAAEYDSYYQQKLILDKAKDKDIMLELDIPDIADQVEQLRKLKMNVNSKFSAENPLNDTADNRLKSAFGV